MRLSRLLIHITVQSRILTAARILLLFSGAWALAQTPDTATIFGQVLDPTHAGIAGAQIAAMNVVSGIKRTVMTDAAGHFSIAGLPVTGSYTLTASKPGF